MSSVLSLHRCKVCGTAWLLWPAGVGGTKEAGWNLLDKYQQPGQCCNNAAMGEQIEHLRDIPILMSSDHGPRLRALMDQVDRRYFENWSYYEQSDLGEAIRDLLAFLRASASALPEKEQPVMCVCGHEQDAHGNDGVGHCGERPCRAGACKKFKPVASSSALSPEPPAIEDVVGSVDFGDTTVKKILDDLRGPQDTEQP